MLDWILNDISSFLISLVFAGIIIPQILIIAFRKKLFDKADERKIHKGAIPRLGGIAFFPSILFSFAMVIGFNLNFPEQGMTDAIVSVEGPIYLMICAVLMMFLVGLADDLLGVRYMTKLTLQVLASVLIVLSGISIINLNGFLWIYEIPEWIGWVATSFAVVFVVNSINLIDGIDGLASGLSAMTFVFYAIMFYLGREYVYSLLASAGAGTLIPFFYYNVYGNPKKQKKIFMGDTGALSAGMIIAFSAVAITNVEFNQEMVVYNPILIAMSPLIIPCLDVIRVYFHRVKHHRNPFLPDKSHIHHKLLALGLSQRAVLGFILLWALLFIIINLILSPYFNSTFIILGDIVIWIIVNIIITNRINIREKKLGHIIYN